MTRPIRHQFDAACFAESAPSASSLLQHSRRYSQREKLLRPLRSALNSRQLRYSSRPMRTAAVLLLALVVTGTAHAQLQVELKFPRLQYVAYEPVVATVKITNLAGRDVELHDE